MVAILGASGGGPGAIAHGSVEFALQMGIGLLCGFAGGHLLRWLLRHLPLPNEALYPLRTIAFALLIYGVTTLAHGSGFLAVLLAGILVGDTRAPYKREIEHFASGLASLAEIVAFTILGLSIPLTTAIGHGRGWTALGIAALLALVVRPVLVGLVLWPVKLRLGERAFVLWAGLKGVVPILLGTYIVAEHEPGAERLYSIIFVDRVALGGGAGRSGAGAGPRVADPDARRRSRALGDGHAVPRQTRGAPAVRRRAGVAGGRHNAA